MILALDLSDRTGWAIEGGPSGVLDLKPYAYDLGRLGYVFHTWLADHLDGCAALVIERPYVGVASETAMRPGHLAFVAHTVAYVHAVPRFEVAPSSWRKVVLSNGKMSRKEAKAAAIKWALDHGHTPQDDNHADALCLIEWWRQTRPDLEMAA